ncbi:hypothetical protein GCM10011404_04490 [Sphingomonas prati]|nr:hypothetical protein GCM10011404_04490 [Sphingomonas prati]
MAELLGRDLEVARLTQVARVAVIVRAALVERHDVIDLNRQRGPSPIGAALTQAVGVSQSASALGDAGRASQAFNHNVLRPYGPRISV